jgi:hypothetical protein
LKKNVCGAKKPFVVVATVKREPTRTSVRNERIDAILDVLHILKIRYKHIVVRNYSFEDAYSVYTSYPEASAYLCLSDPLAVGIKHILLSVKNARQEEWEEAHCVGFDNSPLAERAKICSFDQGMGQIPEIIGGLLSEYFQSIDQFWAIKGNLKAPEIPLDVELIQRGKRS